MQNRKSGPLIAISLLSILSGCATPVSRPSEPQLESVRVSPRHVNVKPVKSEGSEIASLAYAFPVIEGDVFGGPAGTALSIVDDNRASFDLQLKKIWSAASAAAKPLTEGAKKSGISIAPTKTRMLRVGTFLVDQDKQSLLLADVQFRDSMDDIPLVLIYVDRPCRMSGVVHGVTEGRADVVEIDVTLKSAGFHWLSFVPQADGRALIREHQDSDAVLLVVRPQTPRLVESARAAGP
jgi:hypothetical protein